MKKCFSIIKNYGIITVGTLITAISISLLLAPNKLAGGGVSGISTVLYYITLYPIGIISLILNIPLFLLGLNKEGKAFGIKTLYATVILSVFIDALAYFPPLTDDVFLASVFGGLVMGVGLGIVFLSGATTGGTDIVAKLIKRKIRHFPIGRIILIIDVLIITFATIVFQDIKIGLYSAIALYTSSIMIDAIIDGGKFAKTVFIISDNYLAIAECINNDLQRGVTGLVGYGMYSGKPKTILMCTLKRNEIPKLKDVVRSNDKSAFVILADVREVFGEGFINYEGGNYFE